MRLPDDPESITPAWLASVLDGWDPHESISVQRIGQERGIGGCLLRVTAPGGSVVVKLPLGDEPSSLDWLRREIDVYSRIGSCAGIGVPAVLHAAANAHGAVLVMEDLKGLRSADDVAGCRWADAVMAVTALGRFHGRWMQDPLLEALERDGIAPAVEGSRVRLVEDLNEALPLVGRVPKLV